MTNQSRLGALKRQDLKQSMYSAAALDHVNLFSFLRFFSGIDTFVKQ